MEGVGHEPALQERQVALNTRTPWALAALLLTAGLSSCAAWFFSTAVVYPDRTHPVVRIETRKGFEYGAATSEGILFLNQRGSKGSCRVHYFLGDRLMTEAGVIAPLGGVYHQAVIDLKHQWVPVLTRDLHPDDKLLVMLMDDDEVERFEVFLADDPAVTGDAIKWPGRELPAGASIWVRKRDRYYFAGLVSAKATLTRDGKPKHFYLFTGPARLREALATPRPTIPPRRVKHRPDGITVTK